MIVPEKPPWGGKKSMIMCVQNVFTHVASIYASLQEKEEKSFKLPQDREEKCDVMLPWQHYFWMTTKTNNDGDGKKNGRKIKCLYIQTTTLHVNHAILYISLPSLHHYDMKLPNFTSPLYGVGEHNTQIVTFFF